MILIDTGPLVALCDRRDALHKISGAHLEKLKHNSFGVCTATLTEACFLLPGLAQRDRLRKLIINTPIVPVESELSAAIWADVFEWLEKYSEHEPDYADAWLAVLSGWDLKARIWTYDQEFSTIWRRLDGTPIPLAVEHE